MRTLIVLVCLCLVSSGCASSSADTDSWTRLEPTPAANAPPHAVVLQIYDVSDLIGHPAVPRLADGDRLDALAGTIRESVSPGSWGEGGAGTVTTQPPGVLVVKAPESVHHDIAGLLDDLREAQRPRR